MALPFNFAPQQKSFLNTNGVLWYAISGAKATTPPQFSIPAFGGGGVLTFYAVCIDSLGVEISRILLENSLIVYDSGSNTYNCDGLTDYITPLSANNVYYFEVATADGFVFQSELFNTFTDNYTTQNTKLNSNGAVQWFAGTFDLKLFDLNELPFGVPQIESDTLPAFSFQALGTGAINLFNIICFDLLGNQTGATALDETQIILADGIYACAGNVSATEILPNGLFYFTATDGIYTYFSQPFGTLDINLFTDFCITMDNFNTVFNGLFTTADRTLQTWTTDQI